MTVAVAVLLLALRCGDQLGEHPGERVDLVLAERGAGGGVRLRLAEHPLEPEHQRVAHLPLRARPGVARLDLGGRVVERATPRRSRGEHLLDVFAVMKEWLARPRLGAVCSGGKLVRRLGEDGRLYGFLHVRSTSLVLQTSKGARSGVPLVERRRVQHTRRSGVVNYPVGVPELPIPPKTAKGFPGTVSQTRSPPGSTSPCTRSASRSASSFEAVPTIRYFQRRSTE